MPPKKGGRRARQAKPTEETEVQQKDVDHSIARLEEEKERMIEREEYVRLSLAVEKKKANLATMEKELAELQLQNTPQHATPEPFVSPSPMSQQATRVCDMAEQMHKLQSREYDPAPRVCDPAPLGYDAASLGYNPIKSVAARLDLNPQVYLGVGNTCKGKYRPIVDFIPRLHEEQEVEIASSVVLKLMVVLRWTR
jgi:hypothetical protein